MSASANDVYGYLQPFSEQVASVLGLTHLAPHLPTILASFVFWILVQNVLSPLISPLISSTYALETGKTNKLRKLNASTYPESARALATVITDATANANANTNVSAAVNGPASKESNGVPKPIRKRTLKGWHSHSVALIHALVVTPLAFTCLNLSELDGQRERAFGWSPRVGFVQGIACGFLWDILDAIINFESVGFILHGAACLTVYLLGYRPFLAYYGPRFILWEISTPFLNFNWFFERTRLYGSKFHFLNGLALLLSFFAARLVYGSYMSYNFWTTIIVNRANIPGGLFWTYGAGNILLNGLNWFWFSKMVNTIRRRFYPSAVKAVDSALSDSSVKNGAPKTSAIQTPQTNSNISSRNPSNVRMREL